MYSYLLSLIFCFILAVSCAGYRFRVPSNPFAAYDVKSLAVPMFVNESIFPNLSGDFTREIMTTLSEFPGLTLYPGDTQKADAILLGIISSEDHWSTSRNMAAQFHITNGDYRSEIGNRRDFYVPRVLTFKLVLTIYVIKNPVTPEERELILKSPLRAPPHLASSILFQGPISLPSYYVNELATGLSGSYPQNKRGATNFTKTRGNQTLIMASLAQKAAQQFKDMMLYAF